MPIAYQIVVCGSVVPDPLQTLEPITTPTGPALKNELMLPAVLDPWAGHALFEAANLAKQHPGSKVWLVSVGPKAKLQQVMMTVAQKVPFELIALDGPAGGFAESAEIAAALAGQVEIVQGISSRGAYEGVYTVKQAYFPQPLHRVDESQVRIMRDILARGLERLEID